jgi:hypothetical protein
MGPVTEAEEVVIKLQWRLRRQRCRDKRLERLGLEEGANVSPRQISLHVDSSHSTMKAGFHSLAAYERNQQEAFIVRR